MSKVVSIHHRACLVIRLLDSITGLGIRTRSVMFELPEYVNRPVCKDDGIYLFLNMEIESMELGVHVYGYEPVRVQVNISELQKHMPIWDIYVIPLDFPAGSNVVLSLKGKLSGITAIEAVSPYNVICNVKNYQERKRLLTLMNPHNVRLSKPGYGLLSIDRNSYEKMEIEDDISTTLIKLKEGFSAACTLNQPIVSVIHGQVSEDGTYLIKVPESQNPIYLVRYVVDDEVYFQKMDFHQLEDLKKGE